MTFTQVREYAVGLIRASFTNKSVLDKFSEENGVLSYDGTAVGASEETITAQELAAAIAADVNEINGVEDEEDGEEEEQNP